MDLIFTYRNLGEDLPPMLAIHLGFLGGKNTHCVGIRRNTARCCFTGFGLISTDPTEEKTEDFGLNMMGYLVGIENMYVSNEKKPGWLGFIGDFTTQLYKDYNNPL